MAHNDFWSLHHCPHCFFFNSTRSAAMKAEITPRKSMANSIVLDDSPEILESRTNLLIAQNVQTAQDRGRVQHAKRFATYRDGKDVNLQRLGIISKSKVSLKPHAGLPAMSVRKTGSQSQESSGIVHKIIAHLRIRKYDLSDNSKTIKWIKVCKCLYCRLFRTELLY